MPGGSTERIGPFSIERELGRGGMGIVYLGRDPKLQRQVAIKVLPAAVSKDPAALARFRREATLLAALNHPNIAAIHNVEDADGHQLLVLEYVPGPTLADVLASPAQAPGGRLPLEQALPMASQIAAALEAAHEQGIVHRDLKPANIKVRDDGTVKVLDFGLAKSATDTADFVASSDVATITSPARIGIGSGEPGQSRGPMTQMGVILGTAAYMSPEQARGRPVDKRADLWAFGVVLHEMLTGVRLFAGETVTDVIASVITHDPDWSRLPADTPEPIRRLLRRCLQKDPRRRLRDASDARLEIEDAMSAGAAPAHSGSSVAPPQAQPASPRWAWLLAAGVAGFGLAAAGYFLGASKPGPISNVRRLSVVVPGAPVSEVISPDGAWLAARTESGLHARRLDQTEWRELPGSSGAHSSFFWSPDSRYIVFPAGAALRKVDVDGGARATTICEGCVTPGLVRGGSLREDGTMIIGDVGGTGEGLKQITAEGMVSPLTTLNRARGENSHRNPMFLPDGRRFLFAVRRDNGEHEIQIGSMHGEAPRVLMSGFSRLVYRDGYLFFARGYALMAQRFDPDRATLSGEPTMIVPRIAGTVAVAEAFYGVSHDGTLVYANAREFEGAIWAGRDGRRIAIAIPDAVDDTVRVSPDGTKFAAAVHDFDKASTDIIVVDVASGARLKLTSHPRWDQNPVWSPDSRQVAYRGFRDKDGIFVQGAAGGPERAVLHGDGLRSLDWSRDGRILASRIQKDVVELILVPAAGGPPVTLTTTTDADGTARFSPDGKFLAYESRESGSVQIHVRSLDPSFAARVTTQGGTNPVWSRDGRELLYLDHDRWVVAVPLKASGVGLTFGSPARLFRRINSGNVSAAFDVDPSGRFLLRQFEDDLRDGVRTVLSVIQGWSRLTDR